MRTVSFFVYRGKRGENSNRGATIRKFRIVQTEGKRLLRWGCKRISVRESMIVAAHHR